MAKLPSRKLRSIYIPVEGTLECQYWTFSVCFNVATADGWKMVFLCLYLHMKGNTGVWNVKSGCLDHSRDTVNSSKSPLFTHKRGLEIIHTERDLLGLKDLMCVHSLEQGLAQGEVPFCRRLVVFFIKNNDAANNFMDRDVCHFHQIKSSNMICFQTDIHQIQL